MCLFSSSQVHAQNNARREFKFHQENIRAKKRNNDLQKARRGKSKISKNMIRVRYTSGEGNGEGYAFPEWKITQRQNPLRFYIIHLELD